MSGAAAGSPHGDPAPLHGPLRARRDRAGEVVRALAPPAWLARAGGRRERATRLDGEPGSPDRDDDPDRRWDRTRGRVAAGSGEGQLSGARWRGDGRARRGDVARRRDRSSHDPAVRGRARLARRARPHRRAGGDRRRRLVLGRLERGTGSRRPGRASAGAPPVTDRRRVDHSGDALEGFDVSAWMLAIGFSMAAAGPVFVGALRDLAGGFEARIAVLAALAAAAEVLALTAVPRRGRSMVETPL
jgi:hypothetical protein